MQTRSSNNWKTYSGVFDAHNLKHCNFSKEVPDIGWAGLQIDDFVVTNANDYKKINSRSLVNMFLSDYTLERFWRKPLKYIELFSKAKYVMSPDFSLYQDMPNAVKIYNTFRSRLIGYIYECNGIKVVPTISWAGEETFEYCFKGVKQNSVVAVSMVSIKSGQFNLFESGFQKMLQTIQPTQILMQRPTRYKGLFKNINIIDVDPFYFKFSNGRQG